MVQTSFTVRARWDKPSRAWRTDSQDIPGLCCQAASFDDLVDIVFALAPELLIANGLLPASAGDVPLRVTAERRGTARNVPAELGQSVEAEAVIEKGAAVWIGPPRPLEITMLRRRLDQLRDAAVMAAAYMRHVAFGIEIAQPTAARGLRSTAGLLDAAESIANDL